MFLTFLNFPGLFACWYFRTYPVSNQNTLSILASEILVLARARSVSYPAKFKNVENTGDLICS